MNIWLQIGAGLVPAMVVTIFVLIKRRAFSVKNICFTLLLMGGCGFSIVYGGISFMNSRNSTEENIGKTEMLEFANSLIKYSDYDDANDVLSQYSSLYGYDDDCRLATARIYLLQGNYECAAGLYSYLYNNTDKISEDSKEVKAALANTSNNESKAALMNYITAKGASLSDYGYSDSDMDSTVSGISADEVQTIISDSIESAGKGSGSLDKYAAAVAKTALADADNSNIDESVKVFRSMEKNQSEYLSIECVKNAEIKSYVMSGKFDNITGELDENSSYGELMIAAELYMGNFVKKGDFSKYYHEVNESDISLIKEQLKKIQDKEEDELSVQEKKLIENRIRVLIEQLDDAILLKIKEQLVSMADAEAGTDRTKVYLELAKIENYFGNETSTDQDLSIAIFNSQDCEDESYVEAMSQIISIINNRGDDSENIKNVTDYVEKVMDHSLTIDVEAFISSGNDDNSDQEESQDNYYDSSSGNDEADDTDDESSDDSEGRKGFSFGDMFHKGNSDESENDEESYDDTEESTDVAESPETQSADSANSSNTFEKTTVDYVSRAKSALNIGKIDTSNFENITANVQINSKYISDEQELKNAIDVYDCGAKIDDFTLKKIDYTNSNIMLVCDVSGSMEYSMNDLKNAVTTFIKDKNNKENLAIVTFNSGIVESRGFGSSDSDLQQLVSNMVADGGTDMYSAVMNCLGNFTPSTDQNNVLILMTDGKDNDPVEEETIYSELGELAKQKQVTIYTLGLGTEVDTSYLGYIADSGEGDFIYISDSSSLTSFYDMLHMQVDCQYELSYKAKDTMTVTGRTLEVKLSSEYLQDTKIYSLDSSAVAGNSTTDDISISGISPRYIYKGLRDIPVKLKGRGFKKDSSITVKLNGNIDYVLKTEYEDGETYKLVIPSSIAVGIYDVEINIDGKMKILSSGFSVVVQGSEKTTKFGPYVFTSITKQDQGDGRIRLSGAVTLNGWLHFDGEVELVGDVENDGSIQMTDNYGSYVQFDKDNSSGLGAVFAEKGISLELPALGELTLYNDQAHIYDYSNYMVDDVEIGLLEIFKVFMFDRPTVRLYPNSVGVYYKTGTSIFPYQDKILKAMGNNDDWFSFSGEDDMVITNENIGIILDFSYKDPSGVYSKKGKMLNCPIYMNGSFDIKADTFKNEYMLGVMASTALFAKESGFGVEAEWKDNLIPDSVKLKLKLKQGLKLRTTIPIEANDFAFKVSNIAKAVESGSFASLKFAGSVSLTSCKAIDYFPALEKYIGDASLLSMPNTTAELGLKPFSFSLNAELKVFDEIQVADADLKMGTFSVTDSLLRMDGAEVSGIRASLKKGISWSGFNDRVSLELSGTQTLNGHSRFIGFEAEGIAKYDIKWWMINSEKSIDGKTAFGLFTTNEGKMEFIFAFRGQNSKGKNKNLFYYIDENGKCGKNNGTLN